MLSAFKVYALIVSLVGGPPSLIRSNESYPDKAACEAALPGRVEGLQAMIEATAETRGRFAVAGAKCLSDA